MRDTLEALAELEETLNRLDGRNVHTGRSGVADVDERDIDDLTEKVSKALARKLRREGLL